MSERLFEKYGITALAGKVLFKEGEPGRDMYIIHKGSVRITRKVRGIEKTLTVLRQGEFFGEMSVLNDRPRSASAEAVEDCELLVIGREVFEAMVRDDPEIALRMMKKLAARLREADDQIEDLLIGDNPGRVVNFIARKISGEGGEGGEGGERGEGGEGSKGGGKDRPAVLEMTASSIAGMLGISEDHVAVILGKLERVEMLRAADGKLTVTDPRQFRRFSKFLEVKESFSELAGRSDKARAGNPDEDGAGRP